MWRRRSSPAPADGHRPFDVRDREALEAALALVRSDSTSLTVYMCWHGGTGHDYPADVMQAARRLRERHIPDGGPSDAYTSLTFVPSKDDLADFFLVAPCCDLAYATDANGDVVLEVSGEGDSGSLRSSEDAGRDRR